MFGAMKWGHINIITSSSIYCFELQINQSSFLHSYTLTKGNFVNQLDNGIEIYKAFAYQILNPNFHKTKKHKNSFTTWVSFFNKHFFKLILHISHIVISHMTMNPYMEHRCDIVM
jgi:hypothetical protein